MNSATIVECRTTARNHLANSGAIPASSLHFRTGRRQEADGMVLAYHYSKRVPSNVQMIGSLHLDGGLFGGDGPMVAAAFWTIPPTRWKEPVIELARLVRGDERVPLTLLVSLCVRELKKRGNDLLISFADKTQGHEGYVYRASNWRYSGKLERRMDGLMVNGQFIGGRACNHKFGTRSPDKVKGLKPGWTIEPHFDQGKHCYWLPLGKKGEEKAARLGLVGVQYGG